MVKSNSCSSRLELAGTGLDEQQLRENQSIMQSIQNRSETMSGLDAEESVRTMVSRLEVGAINNHQKSMPRIIESKCIEKMNDSIKTPEQQEQNAHTRADDKDSSRLDMLLTTAQVNSHINYNNPSLQIGTVQPMQPELRTKVVRNRNVDLATKSESNKDAMGKSSIETYGTTDTSTTYIKNAKNLLNHLNEVAQPPTTVTSSKKLDSTMNSVNEEKNADDAQNLLAPRLVKWNTLSKFDEKNYVTNDVKLKQKPKYDEIEFEEFQVFDPSNPNAECYDSLNSK